ncbi:uncharacterized protein LOC110437313 [Sorghum bicolor]|uniref:uncharacterized protein LOC110437313 n=1 Tax=Sorghum bicolor TaxID=4558 RepID=UPI000B423C52|nr:uncharacterized protein LOC110437313 [Sorghum bicolor]|eukprot:XP_021321389.1 uncharacterized protein LOC110437313 [Sorghum bicolor]
MSLYIFNFIARCSCKFHCVGSIHEREKRGLCKRKNVTFDFPCVVQLTLREEIVRPNAISFSARLQQPLNSVGLLPLQLKTNSLAAHPCQPARRWRLHMPMRRIVWPASASDR